MKKRFNNAVAVAVATCAAPYVAATPVNFVDVATWHDKALFTMLFEELPDFYSTDEYGRQRDSFQFFIQPERHAIDGLFNSLSTVIRGDEIHTTGEIITRQVLEDIVGANYGAYAGGWGVQRSSDPFIDFNRLMAFTIPISAFNDTDGIFSYTMFTTRWGAMEQDEEIFGVSHKLFGGRATQVDEPASYTMMLAGLVLLWMTRKWRARHVQARA